MNSGVTSKWHQLVNDLRQLNYDNRSKLLYFIFSGVLVWVKVSKFGMLCTVELCPSLLLNMVNLIVAHFEGKIQKCVSKNL